MTGATSTAGLFVFAVHSLPPSEACVYAFVRACHVPSFLIAIDRFNYDC